MPRTDHITDFTPPIYVLPSHINFEYHGLVVLEPKTVSRRLTLYFKNGLSGNCSTILPGGHETVSSSDIRFILNVFSSFFRTRSISRCHGSVQNGPTVTVKQYRHHKTDCSGHRNRRKKPIQVNRILELETNTWTPQCNIGEQSL